MRIAIVTRRLPPPFFLGGVEVNHRILGEELISAGHDVLHFGSYVHPRWQDDRLLPEVLDRVRVDPALTLMRGWTPALVNYGSPYGAVVIAGEAEFAATLEAALEQHRPDFLLTTCVGSAIICNAAARMGIPSVSWVQDIGEDGIEAFHAGATRTVFGSRYLSRTFTATDDPGAVFYPPFRPMPFLPPAPAQTVLMVNAIPEKGSDLFLALARARPDIGFTALTGWRRPEWLPSAPPNVVCLDRSDDPVPAFRSADVVLMPSPVPEGFGRVAVEAALLGRRVLCHDLGGLRESAGLPENLLPDLEPATWLNALSSVLAEDKVQSDVLRRSRDYAERFVRPAATELVRLVT